MNETGENGTLTPKQQRFLISLVTHRTVDAAAKAVGVGKTTAYGWLRETTFASALKRVELETINGAARSLIAIHDKATAALESVLDDPEASSSSKIRAASEVITSTLKIREIVDLESRIAALEDRLSLSEGRA